MTQCSPPIGQVRSERELRRRNSAQSWSTTASLAAAGIGGIPARFRVMDPRRKTFKAIVEEVRKPRRVATRHPCQPQQPRTFESANSAGFEDEVEEEEAENGFSDARVSDLEEDEDSDWSDEERAELEKMFGAMSARGQSVESVRRARRSMRRSRRRAHDLSSDLARLVFSREVDDSASVADSGSVSLSCDTASGWDSGSEMQGEESGPSPASPAAVRRSDIPTLSFTCHSSQADAEDGRVVLS